MTCVIYMGSEDVRRQELNVFRMEMLGAKVRLHFISSNRSTSTPLTGDPCYRWFQDPEGRSQRSYA